MKVSLIKHLEKKDAASMFIWFLLWIGVGVFSLYIHNLVLPYIYLVFAALVYFLHLFLACTRCHYFGLACYLHGGALSSQIFEARRQGPMEPDDSIVSALWLILGLFPVPFLVYYQDWFWAVFFSALCYGWFYYRRRLICGACKNEWCAGRK